MLDVHIDIDVRCSRRNRRRCIYVDVDIVNRYRRIDIEIRHRSYT